MNAVWVASQFGRRAYSTKQPPEKTLGSMSKLAILSASLALTFGALPAGSTALPWCGEVSNTWKVSVLPHGYFTRSDGGRGFIRVTGDTLSYYDQGKSYPVWTVELAPDGSANTTTGGNGHNRRHIRIKVAAGTAPREITTVNETTLRSYIYIPD
jgi:hypothetical protein